MTDEEVAIARLRALYDLEIVRGWMGDSGFLELVLAGFAVRRLIPTTQGRHQCDFKITPEGRDYAARLFRP